MVLLHLARKRIAHGTEAAYQQRGEQKTFNRKIARARRAFLHAEVLLVRVLCHEVMMVGSRFSRKTIPLINETLMNAELRFLAV